MLLCKQRSQSKATVDRRHTRLGAKLPRVPESGNQRQLSLCRSVARSSYLRLPNERSTAQCQPQHETLFIINLPRVMTRRCRMQCAVRCEAIIFPIAADCRSRSHLHSHPTSFSVAGPPIKNPLCAFVRSAPRGRQPKDGRQRTTTLDFVYSRL